MRQITNPERKTLRKNQVSRQDLFLIVLLFLLQIADGTLTALGIHSAGGDLAMEGNPWVRTVMEYWGVVPGLIIVKSVACIIVVFVYNICRRMGRLSKLSRGAIYLTLYCYIYAVVLWMHFLIRGW